MTRIGQGWPVKVMLYFFVYCPAKFELLRNSKTLPPETDDVTSLGEAFLFYTFRLSQVAQHRANIGIEQNGLSFKPFHSDGLAQIDAGVGGLGILRRHTQERHFDDAGGIAADPKLQEQNASVPMPMQKILIPPRCGIPALILHKGFVTAQVRGLWPAALGAARDQLRRDTHIRLLRNHLSNSSFIIISGLMACLTALPETVIALGIEQPRLIKTSQLKLMIHIGGQDEVVLILDQIQQIRIGLAGRHIVAVVIDVSAPPGPVFLRGGKRIEPTGIHIRDTVLLMEVGEVFQKALAAIGQTGGCRKTGARTDENSICSL